MPGTARAKALRQARKIPNFKLVNVDPGVLNGKKLGKWGALEPMLKAGA